MKALIHVQHLLSHKAFSSVLCYFSLSQIQRFFISSSEKTFRKIILGFFCHLYDYYLDQRGDHTSVIVALYCYVFITCRCIFMS